MRFSIIVPIYNKECYVRECLESIRNQSFKDFECLMIDDGSTDSSSRICKEFSRDDDRFKYFYKENGGLVSARKFGAHHVSGDYVINVDADDFIKNDFLKVISEEIERSSPDTVCFRYTVFKSGLETDANISQPNGCFEGEKLVDLLRKFLFDDGKEYINSGSVLFNICTKAIKRELYIKCQDKVNNRVTSGEDTVFSFLWCFHCKKVSLIDYAGYIYRHEETSIEHTFNMRCFANLDLVCDELGKINKSYTGEYFNGIKAYQFYRLERYIFLLAQSSKGVWDFKKKIGQLKNEDPKLFDVDFRNNFRKGSNIRYLIAKNKLFIASYVLAKTIYKGKLY